MFNCSDEVFYGLIGRNSIEYDALFCNSVKDGERADHGDGGDESQRQAVHGRQLGLHLPVEPRRVRARHGRGGATRASVPSSIEKFTRPPNLADHYYNVFSISKMRRKSNTLCAYCFSDRDVARSRREYYIDNSGGRDENADNVITRLYRKDLDVRLGIRG